MKLKDLQKYLSEHVYKTHDHSGALEKIITTQSFSNLEIYQNNLLQALTSALKENFPTVSITLGENNFSYFTHNFILKNPSRDMDLGNYSKGFITYLEETTATHNLEYLSDLAELDWLFGRAVLKPEPISVSKGLLSLWEHLQPNNDTEPPEVDLNEKELIGISEDNNELYMSILKS